METLITDDMILMSSCEKDIEFIEKYKAEKRANEKHFSNGDMYNELTRQYIRVDRNAPYPNKIPSPIRELKMEYLKELTDDEIDYIIEQAAGAPESIEWKLWLHDRKQRQWHYEYTMYMIEREYHLRPGHDKDKMSLESYIQKYHRNTYHSLHGKRVSLPGAFRWYRWKNRHVNNSQQRKRDATKKYHKVFKIQR